MPTYNTKTTYNGDGTTTEFSIPFDYLSKTHVVVSRQNGAVTYYYVNPNLIHINAPLAVGDVLTIQRITDISDPAVTFANGSVVTAEQLNSGFAQGLFASQESSDQLATAVVEASGFATVAGTKATEAAASAAAAATSETNAAASAASAASALDNFDDRYLGQKASDPTVDNDGNALLTGALYFNTVNRVMRVYDGAAWLDASSAAPATMYTYTYVATAGQTVFTGADANGATLLFVSPYLIVSVNGIQLRPTVDYTTTGTGTVTLTSAAAVSDEVQIIAFRAFDVANVTASSVSWQQSGTGAPVRTVLSKLRDVSISIEDFYTGTLPYVNPYTSTSYATRQTAPDISDALDAALAEAASTTLGGSQCVEVRIPPGLYTISRSITRPNNVFIVGSGCDIGPSATHIRRTGDFGSSFVGNPGVYVSGTFVSGGGFRNFRLYVDHGGNSMWGYFNPSAGSFINKTTTGAHFEDNFPKDVVYENLSLWGMPYTFSSFGGADCKFRNLDVHGIWDPLSTARQEGIEAFNFYGDLTNGIPTSHDFHNITISGEKAAGSLTYPGGFTKTTVINQGFRRGFVIRCAEEWRVSGLYIQGMAESDLVFHGKPNSIIQGIKFSNCGFDPCGAGTNDAAIRFEDEGVTSAIPTALSFSSCQLMVQGNGYIGISDRGTTSGKFSVCGLTWDGEMSTFVGVAVRLERASHVNIGGSIRAFNNDNYYTGDDACGVYFGAESVSWSVSATIGGSSFGATTGHYCIDGVRSAASASNNRLVTSINGGLSGSLYVANGKIMDRLLDDGSVEIVGSGNFTYNIKTNGKRILVNSPLTANQTITLPTTGVPTGWTVYIQRTVSATGAFNIAAGGLVLSATNTYGVLTYYDGVGWINMEKGVIS